MKNNIRFSLIILAFAFMLLVSCFNEQPTKVTQEVTFDKHTIQNDSNWVEITDIEKIDFRCVHPDLLKEGIVINSDSVITNLYNESRIINDILFKHLCDTFMLPEVNYNSNSLIGISWKSRGGVTSRKLSFYKHRFTENYVLIYDFVFNPDKDLLIGVEFFKIPKIIQSQIKYDTIYVAAF